MVIPRWRVGFPRVTHPFATRVERNKFPSRRVRLACIRHAASVHPEPGSNSHERSWVSIDSKIFTSFCFFNWLPPTMFRIYRCSNLRWTLSHLVCLSLFSFQWACVASKKQLLYNNKVNLRSQHFFSNYFIIIFLRSFQTKKTWIILSSLKLFVNCFLQEFNLFNIDVRLRDDKR